MLRTVNAYRRQQSKLQREGCLSFQVNLGLWFDLTPLFQGKFCFDHVSFAQFFNYCYWLENPIYLSRCRTTLTNGATRSGRDIAS